VIGTSGSGKSSLVRSGLIPSLHSGLMAAAGSSWRVSVFRPGADPIGHLAEALNAPDVIGADAGGELATTNRVLLEATLRRGSLGLVDAVSLRRLPSDDNVLIVVDQFEELFRFRRGRSRANLHDEAVAFVRLLLEAHRQCDLPIFVVLTMRSDFIGDCMDYPRLPEAINNGLYLVPRMTRDELRSAITGPVAVAGGEIAPRLVVRLLNEVGDDQDQLPLLQHVLMRSWDHWTRHRASGEPIDLADYEAVGTLRNALSMHVEEAYDHTGSEHAQALTEKIFKALTDTFSDPRGIRRPTSIAELAATCEAPESDIVQVVEIFRRSGRSFLMPPPVVPLTSSVVVDISHESLMRGWTRLIGWTLEERAAATLYTRLSREASWYEEGQAGLWGDPELELGLRWRRATRPTAAWAGRYDDGFERAMQFLDRSEQERERQKAERRAQRIRNLRIAWGSAGVLLIAFIIAAVAASLARSERQRAEANLRLAKTAVDETLLATDRDPARIGADVPQLDEFRRDLLQRARPFYAEFIKQKPDSEEILYEMAFARLRLAHIDRMLDHPAEASRGYQEAIEAFQSLARDHPENPEYRQSLADAHNWLGEALRPASAGYKEAESAYASALRLQNELVASSPENNSYKQELARTHYNRGILYGNVAEPGQPEFQQAQADFREAIRLLEPLAKSGDSHASQELARASNNLATVIERQRDQRDAARQLYERAIRIHEGLIAKEPANREYKLELAQFSNNLAELLRALRNTEGALRSNARALALIDELARPAPSLGIEQADARSLRGRIMQGTPDEATAEYRESLELFKRIARSPEATSRADFHVRVGDLLLNLATLCRDRQDADDARRVLSEAVDFYVALGQKAAADRDHVEARTVLENLSLLMSELSDRDRRAFTPSYRNLQQSVGSQPSTPQ
jgi:tetratricopeptide (TPR) repeat protein